MATDSILGLFTTPEQYQQAQTQQLYANQLAQARLSPVEQASFNIGAGAQRFGNALGGMLGAEDPQMKVATARQQALQGLDFNDSAALSKAAQQLSQVDPTGAMQLAQRALEVRNVESQISGRTEEKQAQREMQMQMAREKIQSQIDIARERGATQLQIAQMMQEGRAQLAQLAASMKASQPKALPASLQKDESKDLETIDTYTGQVNALTPALSALTPNEKGVRKLELGPLKNIKYEAQLAAGNSTPEALAYEGLKSAVDTAVNLQVSAEKGVQTDKDVLRFAKALVASYGRNDTEATLQALKRYQESIITAQDRAKSRVESRRRSQGVDPYYVNDTTQQPKRIKLD